MPRFRLIPTTIAASMFFMAVKVVDVIRGTEELSEQLLITGVQAESAPDVPKEIPKDKEKAKQEKPAKDSEGKKEEKDESHKAEGESDPEKKVGKEGTEEEKSNVSDTPGETIDNHLSDVQIALLQKLAERRDELERWESSIQIKENLLNATEKRINDKILQIEAMKEEVSQMLALYNDKEDAKIRSLVKIYENMKPKDAARIFDEVEMPILLLVIDMMAEKKVAPILAEMDPKKAQQLTVELAEQRKIDSAKLNSITSTPQPVPPAETSSQPSVQ